MDSPDFLLWFIPTIIVLAIWDGVWKLISMWHAARNNHKAWFICLAIINTLGILPMIYLNMHGKEKKDS